MQKDEIPNKSHGQTRKTVLIFSAVTALFITIMGYEIIRESESKETVKPTEKKFSIVLNSNKDVYQKPDRIELKLLNAQNIHFSNKIIALKEEANQSSKRLHSLQLSIFSAEKAKENSLIQKLKKSLEIEESLKNELSKNIEKLQENIHTQEEQIVNMESTIDILDQIVYSQKKNKDLSQDHYKAKFEAFQDENLSEKTRLLRLIHDLEANQTTLKIEMQNHEYEIKHLEDELSRSNMIAIDKELEADNLNESLSSNHYELTKQVENLSFIIEAQGLASKHIHKELHYLQSQLAVELERLKKTENELKTAYLQFDEKNEDIMTKNQDLAKADEEVSFEKNRNEDLKIQSQQALLSLNESLFEEKENSLKNSVDFLHDLYIHEELYKLLLKSLETKQQELEQFKHAHHALSHDRNTLSSAIEEKSKHVSSLEENNKERSEDYESKIAALQENIEQMTLNLNLELSRAKELENEIAHRETIFDEKQKLSHEFSEMTDILKKKEHELKEVKEVAFLNQQSNEELKELLLHNEEQLKNLELSLVSLNENLSLNEEMLIAKNESLNSSGERELQLAEELARSQNFYATALKQYDEASEAIEEKEHELQKLVSKLLSFEEELARSQETTYLKQESIEQLNTKLANHETKLTILEPAYSEHVSLNESLTQEIEETKQASSEKENQIKELEIRLSSLEKELESAFEVASLKQESIDKLNAKLTDHESLTHEVEETKKSAIDKENHARELAELLLVFEQELQRAGETALLKQESIEQLNAQLTDHQTKLLSLEPAYSEHVSLNESLTQEIKETKKSAIDKENQATELREHLLALEQQLQKAEEMTSLKEESIEKLHAQLVGHEAKLQTLEPAYNEHVSVIESLALEIEETKRNATENENHARELADQLLVLEQQLQRMEETANLKEEAIEKLNAQLADHEAKLLSLEPAYESNVSLNESLTREIEETKKSASEKENHARELAELLLTFEQELQRSEENAYLKQEAIEKLNAQLSDHQTKLQSFQPAYENNISLNESLAQEIEETKRNATENENHARELADQLLVLEQQLQRTEETVNFKQEAIENLNAQLADHEAKLQSLEPANVSLAQEIEESKRTVTEKENYARELAEHLLTLEGELQKASEIAYLKQEAIEKLNTQLAEHQTKLINLESTQETHISLNEKIRSELEVYQQALDRALILQDIENKSARELESKLEELNHLLKSRDSEILSKEETLKVSHQTNEELSNEIQKAQDSFKVIIKEYEEAQDNTIKNEENVNHLTELILHRERELTEIKELINETSKSNEKLSQDVQKQHEDLELSLQKYKEAEDKASNVENAIFKLGAELKERELELLNTKDHSSSVELQNQQLANEIYQRQQQLDAVLQAHAKAKEESHENEQQLHALIEHLTRREDELIKTLKEKELKKSLDEKSSNNLLDDQNPNWEPYQIEDMENIN